MSATSRFAINALSNWVLNVIQALVGLLVGRIGVAHLGDESFGLFNLLNTVVGFLTLFDIGLSATMFRFAAQDQAAGDHHRLRQTASTTYALFLSLGLLGSVLMLAGGPWLAGYFRVAPEQLEGFYAINLCLAVSFLLRFLSLTDSGLLIGANRYDLINAVDISANLLRIGLLLVIYWGFPPSLWLFGLTFVAQQLVRLVGLRVLVRFHVLRMPLLGPHWVTWAAVQRLSGFGSINALNLLAWLLLTETPNILLGRLLGPAAVTAYYAPKLIATLLRTLVVSFCNPLIPVAGRDAVLNEGRNLSAWSIRLSRLAGIIAATMALPICLLSAGILRVWLGAAYEWTAPVLVIAVLAQVFAGIQAANFYLQLGGGSITLVAISHLVAALAAIPVSVLGHHHLGWGVLGITATFATLHVLCAGVFLPITTAREFGTPLGKFFWHAYGLPALPVLLIGPPAYLLISAWPPSGWFELGWQGALVAGLYLAGAWKLALTTEDRALLRGFLRRGRGVPESR